MRDYDHVIIGAGSAGCILANRLSADPHVSVLLIEAGGADDDPRIHDPLRLAELRGSELDWRHATAPEPALDGRSIPWPRGKILGGCSAINAMIYIRGNRADFDHWAALGCTGWGYAETLPYFKRSERNSRGANAYHGVDGPMAVMDILPAHPICLAFIAAAQELGFPATPDFNGADQYGAGLYQRHIVDGRRVSTASAFLHPVRHRPNLDVITQAVVHRIVLRKGRAVGVEFSRHASVERAIARREVVVSAGTIDTPKLLMLSGIGPADALRRQGITVEADIPGVGDNLQDHAIVDVIMHRPDRISFAEHPSNQVVGLFCDPDRATNPLGPKLQFHCSPRLEPTPDGLLPLRIGSSINVSRPASRGRITLRSGDPNDPPIIEARYFSDTADLRLTIEGLRILRDLMHAGPLREFALGEVSPGPSFGNSPAELERAIRAKTRTIFHPVGTCRMGSGPDAVVDTSLRVHGVEGLRVVDASIMPTITTGNTAAATMMIAEKAADLMRAA